MTDSPERAILALGVSRLVNLHQKERQRVRAKKMAAYLRMSKALHSDVFSSQLRFDSGSLFKLLGLIRPYLDVNDEQASVEETLLATLKYLATGCSIEQLSKEFSRPRLLESTIPVICKAIYKCLREYIAFPKTSKDWEDIASAFEKKWHFRHCLGAFVAKHIAIDKPAHEPLKFLNHKKFHSIVLVAVVNANYEFTYISTGCDGGYQHVYASTEFFEMLTEDSLNMPSDCPLKGTEEPMPFVFLGETDFLIENIMKPYPKDLMTPERKVFNYRFFRARRVAENAFGVLYERFGIFHQNISVKEEDLNCVVMACCALHNFLLRSSKEYLKEDSLDVEDLSNVRFKEASWRIKREGELDTHPLLSLHQKEEAICDSKGEMVRDRFTSYFNNEGKVPFQDKMVHVVPDL